ncbi:nucleolysin TIA-1/TIAR [Vigna unguiculata]|uniref:RING-type E3 ubiquitin transferase n=2 Tax=Vigna unguiculata TaxID=3917 RepID=A0A4D6NIL1_VIGUN|nr:nucleolysin TIA-1/TIAR [Vigna unguiculata]
MTSFHSRKLLVPFHGSIDVAAMNRRIRSSYSPIASPLPSVVPRSFTWFPPPLLDGEHDHLNLASIIIIGLGSIACVIMFLITLSKILKFYYLNGYNVSRRNPPILFDIRGDSPFSDDEEQEHVIRQHSLWFSPTQGLQQSTIDSITVYRYRKNEVLVKESECLVCLGEFQQEENLRLLPKCSHAFHVSCIDTWLRSHKTCPLCRIPIVRDGGSDSDSSVSDMIEDVEECHSGVGGEDSGEEGIEILSEFGDSSVPI